jgi:hypothetical protein
MFWHRDDHLRIESVSVGLASACIGCSGVLIVGLEKRIRSGSERIADASVSIKAGSVAIEPEDVLIETESVRFCRGGDASGPPGVSIRLAGARTSAVSVAFRAAKLE